MSKHTPSPLSASEENGLWYVITKDRHITASINPNPKTEVQANAQLYAAAPELLEALRKLVDAVDLARGTKDEELSSLNPEYHDALAAIAKAEGTP